MPNSDLIKPLLVNDLESVGGAAKAAKRLHLGLIANGVASRYLVSEKVSDDETVLGPKSSLGRALSRFKLRSYLELLPLLFYPSRQRVPFSSAFFSSNAVNRINHVDADLIHLHWVAGGMLRIESLAKIKKPLIWTLHDSWPFTGGCHVPFDCKSYTSGCGQCPVLQSNSNNDLSTKVLKRKTDTWKSLNITIVTPSRWLAECAKSSEMFKDKDIHVIPNGLDIQCFKPIDKDFCRSVLNIESEKKIILFGSFDPLRDKNKGYNYLADALHYFLNYYESSSVEFVIFGASKPLTPPDLGTKVHYMGVMQDETSLALLYSAADVMVVPSIQESFGQTASEALACGCPVVAFETSGLLDIVDHKVNGFLVSEFDSKKLAFGINWVLENKERHHKLSMNAREKAVQYFDSKVVARQYIDLYKKVLLSSNVDNE